MKTIELTQGKSAIVDDADYEWISAHRWYFVDSGKHGYGHAARQVRVDSGGWRQVRMHREIVGAKAGEQVDHINGDPLDNRRSNLRICNNAQNRANMHRKRRSSSRYKGVHWHKRDRRWVATITINGQRIALGSYTDEEEAARAYDRAAPEVFGEFARTNFP